VWNGKRFHSLYIDTDNNSVFYYLLFFHPLLKISTVFINIYWGADKSLARPTSLCSLFDGENISFDASLVIYTGRFIMFSVITNIYKKKTKGPTLMELFTDIGKLKKLFFWQLEMDACVARTWIWYRCVPCTHRTSLVVKKKFSFLVAVNNSIKVGPLVFLL